MSQFPLPKSPQKVQPAMIQSLVTEEGSFSSHKEAPWPRAHRYPHLLQLQELQGVGAGQRKG